MRIAARWFISSLLVSGATVCADTPGWQSQVLAGEVFTPFDVKALMVNGDPLVVYTRAQGRSLALMDSVREDGVWHQEVISASVPNGFFGATVGSDGVVYAGLFSGTSVLSVFARRGDGWVLDASVPLSENDSGYSFSMGTAGGQPFAAFGGPIPLGAGYPQTVRVAQRGVEGSWALSKFYPPSSAEIRHISAAGMGAVPAIFGDTYGGSGAFYATPDGGNWTVEPVTFVRGGFGHMISVAGTPAVFDDASDPTAGYLAMYLTRAAPAQWGSRIITPPPTYELGEDLAIISGTPSVAYLGQYDRALHFAQLSGGGWSDQVIGSGLTGWPDAVSLIDAGGHAAVAYIDSTTQSRRLIWVEQVPEPWLLPLGLLPLLRRPRAPDPRRR